MPSPSTSSAEVEDPVKDRLMTQNAIAHNLAYKIQQAFIQARIEGIGKPFQVLVFLFARRPYFGM